MTSIAMPNNLRLLTGKGDSMSPTFNDKDILFVDVGVTAITIDAVYVFSLQGELYIKRFQLDN